MAINDKLQATNDEAIIAAADAEIEELSDHSRPMVVSEINEA
ncbi:hypothetical protein POF50_015910 [Streptomyces sp. SL13]|uniref:Uncharacterized protein n=1 Tax=Streptantibioticus silvisoli TaxID=2705255 RepID=A0AA90H042_9ACTN|nr:hypothetical protein [Streptantibioticus silvisoli]MDI5966639.1 hypothetical protein [Streptantibioticus silvisoli]MDI5970809.1 hypothetical protein [Streptantibioticus silvisoli]